MTVIVVCPYTFGHIAYIRRTRVFIGTQRVMSDGRVMRVMRRIDTLLAMLSDLAKTPPHTGKHLVEYRQYPFLT